MGEKLDGDFPEKAAKNLGTDVIKCIVIKPKYFLCILFLTASKDQSYLFLYPTYIALGLLHKFSIQI